MRRQARDRLHQHLVAQGQEAEALKMPRLASPHRPHESPEMKRMSSIALEYQRSMPESQARFLSAKPMLTLYPYQETGVAFMFRRTDEPLEFASGFFPAVRGGILADDMRLGKTIESLTFAFLLLQKCVARGEARFGTPILIVVNPDNLEDWLGEMNHVFPAHTLSIGVVHGEGNPRADDALALEHDILITSYSTLVLERLRPLWTRQMTYRAVIFDEAHCLVNPTTLIHKVAVALQSSTKWFVSGTPVQNDPVADKNAALVVIGVPRSILTHPSVANALCDRMLIRRDRWSVGMANPEEKMDVIPLTILQFATVTERKLYNGMIETFAAPVFAKEGQKLALMLRAIHTMRQMCGCPYLVDDLSSHAAQHNVMTADYPNLADHCMERDLRQLALRNMYHEAVGGEEGLTLSLLAYERQAAADGKQFEWRQFMHRAESLRPALFPPVCTKERWLLGVFLDKICEPRGEKGVVFSNWVDALERLNGLLLERQRLLPHKAKRCLIVHGGHKKHERRARIEEFKKNEAVNTLLISMKIGSEGHDFTVANHAVLYDPWWNPNREYQSISRIMGKRQRKQVHIYRLVLEGTVEMGVVDIADEKARNRVGVTNNDDNDPMMIDDDDVEGGGEDERVKKCMRLGQTLRPVRVD